MTLARRARRQQFDAYAAVLAAHLSEAIVFDELDEPTQTFRRAVGAAIKRAGLQAVVRKPRGQAEIRLWLTEEPPLPPAPAITLETLQTIGDHCIAAGSYWFRGGSTRLDRLLREYGYERRSRVAWQRVPGETSSVALTLAAEEDSDELVPVAVIGAPFFGELFGEPAPQREREGGRR